MSRIGGAGGIRILIQEHPASKGRRVAQRTSCPKRAPKKIVFNQRSRRSSQLLTSGIVDHPAGDPAGFFGGEKCHDIGNVVDLLRQPSAVAPFNGERKPESWGNPSGSWRQRRRGRPHRRACLGDPTPSSSSAREIFGIALQVARHGALLPAGTKKRYATGADEQARLARHVIAEALLDRLMHYPAFGPERPAEAHRVGGHNQHRE